MVNAQATKASTKQVKNTESRLCSFLDSLMIAIANKIINKSRRFVFIAGPQQKKPCKAELFTVG
jgi:hypothetical protein